MDDKLDPLQKVEIAMLRAEYQKRFQMAINALKEMVGEGIEYRNAIVRVVVSDRGVYYELADMPEEFGGISGEGIERRFVAPAEAIDTLSLAVDAAGRATRENTRHLSLLVLYTRRGLVDRTNCYLFDLQAEAPPARALPEIGRFQPGVMPLFFRIKVDADWAEEAFGFKSGLILCMANAGDRHLLLRAAPAGGAITDLSEFALSETLH